MKLNAQPIRMANMLAKVLTRFCWNPLNDCFMSYFDK